MRRARFKSGSGSVENISDPANVTGLSDADPQVWTIKRNRAPVGQNTKTKVILMFQIQTRQKANA